MKKILVWSMQHTGTYFCIHAIAAGTNEENCVSGFGSLWRRHKMIGREPIIEHEVEDFTDYFPLWDNRITENWYNNSIFDLAKNHADTVPLEGEALSDIQWDKIKLFVAHEHYHRRHNTLWQSLMKYKPTFPIIVPMRDPFLSLHSKNWREVEKHQNPESMSNEARLDRARSWVDRYLDLLSIPRDHIFILPIDIKCNRAEIYHRLYDYCGLEFNENARQHSAEWAIQNSTEVLIRDEMHKESTPWIELKRYYYDRNIEYTTKVMDIEFNYLKKQDGLKSKMKEIGYNNLLWW